MYIKVTSGFSFLMRVLFFGDGSIDTAKKATRMAIERHGWQLYKETDLTMSAGAHWLATRIFAHVLLQPNAFLTNVLNAHFEPVDQQTIIANIQYSGTKKGVFDFTSSARSRILRRMDEFWDGLSHYATSLRIDTLRADSFLREQDFVHEKQRLYIANRLNGVSGIFRYRCPACYTEHDQPFSEGDTTIVCQSCARVLKADA